LPGLGAVHSGVFGDRDQRVGPADIRAVQEIGGEQPLDDRVLDAPGAGMATGPFSSIKQGSKGWQWFQSWGLTG
jgi:hypothetical protein